jgi:hypothetical protein
VDAIRLLANLGADVDARDDSGYTPLHRAAAVGHMKTLGGGSAVLKRIAYVAGWVLSAMPPDQTRGNRFSECKLSAVDLG